MLTIETIFETDNRLKKYGFNIHKCQIENSNELEFTFENKADIWFHKGEYYVDKLVDMGDNHYNQMQVGSYDNINNATDKLVSLIEEN